MKKFVVFVCCLAVTQQAFAWGHRGHEIVAAIAARLLEEKEGMKYLRGSEYALGYYANVPDVIWKNIGDDVYNRERTLHYLDWNSGMAKIFTTPENLPIDFSEFDSKMGGDRKWGQSPWRIRQFFEQCQDLAKDLTPEKQGPLMRCLGLMSHYIGDLSQPLHVTDNFDGQLTNQSGVHSFFEDEMVNLLDPQLKVDVLKAALAQYDVQAKSKKNYSQRVRVLIKESHKEVETLLKMDKKIGRGMNMKSANQYKSFIQQCLVRGAIATALVWREVMTNVKNFSTYKFYYFDGKPDYVDANFMK